MTPVRLQRYLAQAGVAARRKAEDLIVAGRVTVNGEVVRELGTKVDPDHDRVAVDGQGVHPEAHFYILFNKPKGCITAVSDDRGRPTVMDYLRNLPARVAPVGRLDFYSEGVLLLTNDGELAARLLAPRRHVPKTYHVKVRGQVSAGDLAGLRAGVRLDDGTITRPAEVEVLPGESKHTWLAITLHEGKQRQIHRMLEARGYQVVKLQRVAFANLTFHGLRVGDARELDQRELNELRQLAGLDRREVARGRWTARREDTDLARRRRADELAAPAAGAGAGPAAAGPGPAERSGPRSGPARSGPAQSGADRTRSGPSRSGPARSGADRARTGPARSGPSRGPARSGPSRSGPARSGPARSGADRARSGPARSGPSRSGPSRSGPSRSGAAWSGADRARSGPSRSGPSRPGRGPAGSRPAKKGPRRAPRHRPPR